MSERTVRELGGEIWAYLNGRIQAGEEPFTRWDVETLHATVDLIMGVLARHVGEVIRNDEDLPVAPIGAPQAD
jgi:hypothetical protein